METPTRQDHHARILRVQRHLEAHLDETVPIPELARIAAFSLHHFHRVFRGVTGESVAEYARRLRLERAARRLRTTDRSIIDLALDAGYDAHEAFTRAFHARFGMSPSAFRARPDARVDAFLQRLDIAPRAVEIRRIDPIRVAYTRLVGPYTRVSAGFRALVGWTMERGLGTPALYGRCPDDPAITVEAQLRFDVCAAVDASVQAEGQVGVGEIPGGTYAVAIHRGGYDTLSDTYLALIGLWLPTTSHQLHDEPVVEAYLDDPSVTPVEALRTEVRVRLAV